MACDGSMKVVRRSGCGLAPVEMECRTPLQISDMQLIEQSYRPELAFLPIGDLFTMSPVEAALACRLLKCKKVVPIHWGTFPALTGTPEKLAQELGEGAQTGVWQLDIGKPVNW